MQAYLANAAKTKEVINKYSFAFQKKFGQNFLIDERVPLAALEAAGITKDDCVLEIGPGIGTMTQYLAEAAGRVVAVEIDCMLLPILEDTLQGFDNVRIIHNDILKVDLAALIEEENGGKPIKVVANLPYYITTPILMKLLESSAGVESITVMVQEEVAERIESGPGSKVYGAISLGVQYYAEPRIVCRVSPASFMPQPKVASAVLCLKKRSVPAVSCRDPEFMFALVKGAFLQRRKTLVNALAGYPPAGVTKEEAASALGKIGLDERIRGEALSLEQFAALSEALRER